MIQLTYSFEENEMKLGLAPTAHMRKLLLKCGSWGKRLVEQSMENE